MANVDNKAYNMSDNIVKMPVLLDLKKKLPWLQPLCKCGLSEPVSIGSGKSFSSLAETMPTIQARTSALNMGAQSA